MPGFFQGLSHLIGAGARSRPTAFYLSLAGLFAIAIAVNLAWVQVAPGVKEDLAVRLRLSSPAPDPSILIVDIDERSLALMAPEHGRWPWPRSVIAEMVAGLSDAGARSILVNLTFSDADRDHPEDDAVFQDVLAHTPNVVLPLTRLNPANDGQSRVAITRFGGAVIRDPAAAARPIAVLAPAFPGVYDRLGFNNLISDADGAVRRFDPWHEESGFAFPSLPLRALEAGGVPTGIKPGDFPRGMILNWRNKRGDYARRSFADVAADLDKGNTAPYRGKLVILGASAVGLGSVRGTAASSQADDNTILATAMDDMKSGSWLRVFPAWATALLSLVSVGGLAAAFIRLVSLRGMSILFSALQTGFIAVTAYSISYTNWLVDVSGPVLFALAYFTIANLYSRIHLSALRGSPSFSGFLKKHAGQDFLLAGVKGSQGVRALVRALERRFGPAHVLHVDNLFDRGHVLQQATSGLSFVVVALPPGLLPAARTVVENLARDCRLTPRLIELTEPSEDVRPIFRAILSVAGELA